MTKEALQLELEQERAARKAAEEHVQSLTEELAAARSEAHRRDGAGALLARANNRLVQLIANMQSGIFAVDENRNVLIVNELFCRQFGITESPADLVGMNGREIVSRMKHLFRKPDLFEERINELVAKRELVLGDELEVVTGQVFARDYIPFFTDGEFHGQLWKYTDISRSRTIEATFDSQRRFYEQILNNTPADIVVCTPEYQYLYLNPTAVPDASLRTWMIGKTMEEFYAHVGRAPEEAASRREFFDFVKESGITQEREECIAEPDGNLHYHLRKMYPVLGDDGEVEMVIGYGVEITERKTIEEQIKLSERRYREIFNFSQAWICTHDLLGRLLTINPTACKILDYTETELLGRNLESLMPEKYQSQFTGVYMSNIVTQGKAEGIMNVLTRKKKNIYLLYQNYLVNEPDSEPYIIGFAQNITERIYAEEELKRSEEKYRGIIENMNLGMIEIDLEERIVFANQRFCTMSGYEHDELLRKKATDLFLQGDNLKKTRTRLSKGRYGIAHSYELAVKTKNGQDQCWLTSANPVYGADGQLRGTISIHLDITGQKRLAEQLKDAILSADRLAESKDSFLANMSHEIRTPLNAIMGLSKLMIKDDLTMRQKNYLAGIESASSSLLAIINDLLDFSKIEAGKIAIESIAFNLGAIIEQAIGILTHKAEEKDLQLTYEVDNNIAPVLIGDPYRINQVLMNVLSNAIKFTDEGSVRLVASLVRQEEDVQTIMVAIKDTGIGIKEEYLHKLFDKFSQEDETVERKFGGTGLGMTITKQLMELMGGEITVESAKSKGTTVNLLFHAKMGSARIVEKKQTTKNDTTLLRGCRILLVEDNELNRLLAYTILADYGAQVTEAGHGAEAVEKMRKDVFDLVLMDIQMPVMDGLKATGIIREEISKTVPIIALTANAIKGKEDRFLDSGMNDYIVKPYTEQSLVNPIARCLSKATHNRETPTVMDQGGSILNKRHTAATAPIPEPAAATSSNIPIYDLSKLQSIARNDDSFITRMLQLFISETAQGLQKMNEAYESGDLKTVKYYAHRMKPSIGNLGISSIKQEVLDIEFITERTPALDAKRDLVNKTLADVMELLKKDYNL